MSKSTKLAVPNRSAGGKRWSSDEDDCLIELIKRQEEWGEIARSMKRSFISVQHRYRFLKDTHPQAAAIEPKVSTRSMGPNHAPDLTCGAPSKAGKSVIESVRREIRLQKGPLSATVDETDLILGALIRDLLALRSRDVVGWLRVTVSNIRTPEHGVGKAGFSRLLSHLEAYGMVERTAGVPGAFVLQRFSARQGRFVFIRASARLKIACGNRGIKAANLFTHFPSLAS